MYPYQLSKALADQRRHDLVTRAERHRWASEGRPVRADRAPVSSQLSNAKAHVLAVFHAPVAARAVSREATSPAAGPLGCVA